MNSKYSFGVETPFECAVVLSLSIFALLLSVPAGIGTVVSILSIDIPIGWDTVFFSFLSVFLVSLTAFLVIVPIYFMRVCAWYLGHRESTDE